MSKTTKPVDGYIRKNKQWSAELEALRQIVLETELIEETKWRTPTYTLNGANVVMLGSYNDGCMLSFLKGALIRDPRGLLVAPGPNTQAARVVRFTDVDQIRKFKPVLKDFVEQAIQIEKAGLKVRMKSTADFEFPEELDAAFRSDPALRKAFDALTPGRQRGYLLHFSGAKQLKTRAARIEKSAPRILKGKGLDDE